MKNIILVCAILTTYVSAGGFNFGSCSGSGTFEQEIHQFNNYEDAVTVGEIPAGIQGLHIDLVSKKDVDIRLYGKNNEKIVHWPYGILSLPREESKAYKNMTITYSGYNGVDGDKGHEFISINGTVPTKLTLKAFGYQAGYATVNYSWTGKENCEISKSGKGHFNQSIETNLTSLVGSIPPNVENIEINLTSQKDLDIQLYGPDGTAIVSWKPKGILSGHAVQSTEYHGMHIVWSGYDGVNGHKGHEYIKITPKTTEMLIMKVYGYESGVADVNYSWGKKENNTTDTNAPVITLVGEDKVFVFKGETYVDKGATAYDNKGRNITNSLVIHTNVNINTVGTYTITYDVNDGAGHKAIQKKREVNVLSKEGDRDDDGMTNFVEVSMGLNPLEKNDILPHTSMNDKRMYHILNRFSYGANKELIEEVEKKGGIDAWLYDQLFNPQETFPEKGEDEAQDKLDNYFAVKQTAAQVFPYVRPLHSKHQVQAVMGNFWFNHFNTYGVLSTEMVENNDRFYFKSVGNFRTLLGISAKSAAMSIYLDGRYNVKGAINENYAREVMELHTLGVESYNQTNGYTQEDIQALARILTGWSIKRTKNENNLYHYKWKKRVRKGDTYAFPDFFINQKFVFRKNKHDNGKKIFLGHTYANGGKQEGKDALNALAYHIRTAQFICKKLARKIVSDTPSEATVQTCVDTFREEKNSPKQIAKVLYALSQTEEFKNIDTQRSKVKDTQEYLLSFARLLELDATKVKGDVIKGRKNSIGGYMQSKTKQPFWGKPEPTGWSEVSSMWNRSNTVIDRMQAIHALLTQKRYREIKSFLSFFANKDLKEAKDILNYVLPIMTGGYYDAKDLQKSYSILCGSTTSCKMTDKNVINLLEYLATSAEFNLQ